MISMLPITICLTYFKSLTLANLEAALYSVWQQNLASIEALVIVDNDTADSLQDILTLVDGMKFPVPVRLLSYKHGDPLKTHSWSTNVAVRHVFTPWVLFTRADYLLRFDLVNRFTEVTRTPDWNGFVTGNGCHLSLDIIECERTAWRAWGPDILRGDVFDYTAIDAGVWMARRDAFERVGGLDESLTAWGHAQTHFQYKMHKAGTEFVRIPEVLFYHPQHAAPRDIELAHKQLKESGVILSELWARWEGVQPYR